MLYVLHIIQKLNKLGPLLQVAKLSVYNLSNKLVFYNGRVLVVCARSRDASFSIFLNSSKTPVLSTKIQQIPLLTQHLLNCRLSDLMAVFDECCLERCSNYLVKTVKQSWYCLLKNPDNSKCHLMFCLKVKAIYDAGTIIDIIIEKSALNLPSYSLLHVASLFKALLLLPKLKSSVTYILLFKNVILLICLQ